jgi:hypothetical protein
MLNKKTIPEFLTTGTMKESILINLETLWDDFNNEWQEIVTSVYLDKQEKYESCIIIVNKILTSHRKHFQKIICFKLTCSKPREMEREFFASKEDFIEMLLEIMFDEGCFYGYLESIKDFNQLFAETTKRYIDKVYKLNDAEDYEQMKKLNLEFSDEIYRLGLFRNVSTPEIQFKLSKISVFQKFKNIVYLERCLSLNK